MSSIFLSYRRDDTAGEAGRLQDRLVARFGRSRVFMDVYAIEPGADFVEVIDEHIGQCTVLLIVIGRSWLSRDGQGRTRLSDPEDFHRLEIEAALKRGIRIIPVLVQGATMPREEDLPEELKRLARRHALEVSATRWDYDVGQLFEAVERVLKRGRPSKERSTETSASKVSTPVASPATDSGQVAPAGQPSPEQVLEEERERIRQEQRQKLLEEEREKLLQEQREKLLEEEREKLRQEERVRLLKEEQARQKQAEQARRQQEAQARRQKEEQARREQEAHARREQEAKARREQEAQARREQEERARREQEERAREQAAQARQQQAERERRLEAERDQERQRRAASKPRRPAPPVPEEDGDWDRTHTALSIDVAAIPDSSTDEPPATSGGRWKLVAGLALAAAALVAVFLPDVGLLERGGLTGAGNPGAPAEAGAPTTPDLLDTLSASSTSDEPSEEVPATDAPEAESVDAEGDSNVDLMSVPSEMADADSDATPAPPARSDPAPAPASPVVAADDAPPEPPVERAAELEVAPEPATEDEPPPEPAAAATPPPTPPPAPRTVSSGLRGTFRDRAGETAGVTVRLVGEELDEPLETTTSERGLFDFVAVPPGVYTVVFLRGDETIYERPDLEIAQGQFLTLGINMQPD